MTHAFDMTSPIFHNEDAAREHLEALRWPNGVYCPRCGTFDGIAKLGGKSMGAGWYTCAACRDKFTVRVGTVFERSHIPLHKWVLAFRLMASSKKGVSSHQLHRTLGITYKSAWFMSHRIREAMTPAEPAGPLGGEGKTVEADETFIGRKADAPKRAGYGHKHAVMSLVERGGEVRSFHIAAANAKNVREVLVKHADRKSHLMTDEAKYYTKVGKEYAWHFTVNHSEKEYARGSAHVNTLENYYSIFKRGMQGIYQHCSEQHLHRYVAEFDFRYNAREGVGTNDAERTDKAIKGAEGKRLTYRRAHAEA